MDQHDAPVARPIYVAMDNPAILGGKRDALLRGGQARQENRQLRGFAKAYVDSELGHALRGALPRSRF